jgi:hypothetical protein
MAKFAVRSVQVVFNVEEFSPDGKLLGVKQIPADLFEVQFDTTIESLVSQLLVQANGLPETLAEVEDSKEE